VGGCAEVEARCRNVSYGPAMIGYTVEDVNIGEQFLRDKVNHERRRESI